MMMGTTNKAKLTRTKPQQLWLEKHSSGTYLCPTRDEQDKANHSLLNNHYKQVEETLANASSSLWRVPWENSILNLRPRRGGDGLAGEVPPARYLS